MGICEKLNENKIEIPFPPQSNIMKRTMAKKSKTKQTEL